MEREDVAVAETLTTGGDSPGAEVAADVAVLAGRRYEPLEEVARGGTGRIVRAHDLALDREVALKEPLERGGGARLRAEAHVLAKLQHPSIVPIYDQGVGRDGVPFFAMKLVDGRSLRDVIQDTKTFEERLGLLPVVLAIAEAVAYAHSQGIIHRDLKPANVLVGRFGETIVIDWGLAKPDDRPDGESVRRAAGNLQTVTGTVMGTPAYMPPEQARGEPVDARADVYAIGAILYQLLAGTHPYSGQTTEDPVEMIAAGPPAPLDSLAPRTPPDLLAIVEKAMARHARDRYRSAEQLAQDLVRFQTGRLVAARHYSPIARARRWLWRKRGPVAAVTVALAAAGTATVLARGSSKPPDPAAACKSADAKVREVWPGTRRDAIATSFAATGLPYAAKVAGTVQGEIDRQADALGAARIEVCESTYRRGEQSTTVMDARLACLDQHLDVLVALADGMIDADQGVVDTAPRALRAFDTFSDCNDIEEIASLPPEPGDPDTKAALDSLRARMTALTARTALHGAAEALSATQENLDEARRIGYCPTIAAALIHRAGAVESNAAAKEDFDTAQAIYRDAARTADECGWDYKRAEAMLGLVGTLAYAEYDKDLESQVLADAAALIGRVGDVEMRAELLEMEAEAAGRRGRFQQSIALSEMVMTVVSTLPRRDDPAVAINLAIAYSRYGSIERAEELARHSVEVLRGELGPDHPSIGKSDMVLGNILQMKGDNPGALAVLEDAQRIQTALYPPEHRDVLITEFNLAGVKLQMGQETEAIAMFERLLPLVEKVFGPEHVLMAQLLGNLASATRATDDHAKAMDYARRSVELRTKISGPDHPAVAFERKHVGEILYDTDRFEESVAEFRAVLAIEEKTLDPESPDIASTLMWLGVAEDHTAHGHARAVEHLERSLAIYLKGSEDPEEILETKLRLGQALYRSHQDLERSRQLVTEATATTDPDIKKQAENWLAEHP